MATATQSNTKTSAGTLKAFQDKVKAQVADAKSTLDQLELKANQKGTQAETATITRLKTAKQEIDRKLQDITAAHGAHVARAKSEIEADVATFKASVEDFGAKLKTRKSEQESS